MKCLKRQEVLRLNCLGNPRLFRCTNLTRVLLSTFVVAQNKTPVTNRDYHHSPPTHNGAHNECYSVFATPFINVIEA